MLPSLIRYGKHHRISELRRYFYAESTSSFANYGLHDSLVTALSKAGFSRPTQIQALTYLHSVEHSKPFAKVVAAETGSGKTLAYLAPLVSDLLDSPGKRSLILCPNQMLCEQVAQIASNMPVQVAILTAHSAPLADRGLPDPNVLISTPSSFLRHVEAYMDKGRQANFVNNLQQVVFDEADLLLTGGYDDSIREIFSFFVYKQLQKHGFRGVHSLHNKHLGKYMRKLVWKIGDNKLNDDMKKELYVKHSTNLTNSTNSTNLTNNNNEKNDFSSSTVLENEPLQFVFVAATLPTKAEKSAGNHIYTAFGKNSEWIGSPGLHRGAPNATFEWVTLHTLHNQYDERIKKYENIENMDKTTLLFCNTIKSADALTKVLNEANFAAFSYHKKIPSLERTQLLKRVSRKNSIDLKRIAARGLDIPNLENVLQVDFAESAVQFLHRSGRTARAGQRGIVTSFYTKGTSEEFLVNAVKTALDSGEALEDCFSRRRSFRKNLKKSKNC
eukprot:GSMAST32.ASY1.ANO1.1314.1 assembled CDS